MALDAAAPTTALIRCNSMAAPRSLGGTSHHEMLLAPIGRSTVFDQAET